MPFCINCGVELGADVRKCPLCAYTMPETGENKSTPKRLVLPVTHDLQLARKTRTIITTEVLSIVFAIINIVLAGIDLSINRHLTWSPYPITAVTAFWVYLVLMFFVAKRPYKTFIISACIILLLLVGIDAADGAITWFLPIALPISTSTLLMSFLILFMFDRGIRYSLLIISVAVSISIEACIIDYSVTHFLGQAALTWSPLLVASMVPIIIVALIHYLFLSRHFDAHKYLHF